jgi:hypothetical protein
MGRTQVGLTKVEMVDAWTQVGLTKVEMADAWTQVGLTKVAPVREPLSPQPSWRSASNRCGESWTSLDNPARPAGRLSLASGLLCLVACAAF